MKQHQNQNQNRAVNQPVVEVDGLEEGGGTAGHMTTTHFLFSTIRDQNQQTQSGQNQNPDPSLGSEQLLPDRTRMWTCLILLSLLDQNQAAPVRLDLMTGSIRTNPDH